MDESARSEFDAAVLPYPAASRDFREHTDLLRLYVCNRGIAAMISDAKRIVGPNASRAKSGVFRQCREVPGGGWSACDSTSRTHLKAREKPAKQPTNPAKSI